MDLSYIFDENAEKQDKKQKLLTANHVAIIVQVVRDD